MNTFTIIILKIIRRFYARLNVKPRFKPACIKDLDIASNKILELLNCNNPIMIA